MKFKKPTGLFEKYSVYGKVSRSSIDYFRNRIENKKSLPSKSLAPKITHIIKSKDYSGWIIICFNVLALIGFYAKGFLTMNFYLIAYFIITTSVGIWLIYKSKSLDYLRKKQPYISISALGILIFYKPRPTFFSWENIKTVKIWNGVSEISSPKLIINGDIIIDLDKLLLNVSELNYLLKIYKSRFEDKRIEFSFEFEKKYFNLKEAEREEYIMK